jgi:hypothetical protein
MDRISGLLRNAIENDTSQDPEAAARFDELVHRLEDSSEDFTLWCCCVPAIQGYKSEGSAAAVWGNAIVVVIVLMIIAFFTAKALRLI